MYLQGVKVTPCSCGFYEIQLLVINYKHATIPSQTRTYSKLSYLKTLSTSSLQFTSFLISSLYFQGNSLGSEEKVNEFVDPSTSKLYRFSCIIWSWSKIDLSLSSFLLKTMTSNLDHLSLWVSNEYTVTLAGLNPYKANPLLGFTYNNKLGKSHNWMGFSIIHASSLEYSIGFILK